MPDVIRKSMFLSVLVLIVVLNVDGVARLYPLENPQLLSWRASNSVWMHGPPISFLQIDRVEFAIGTYIERDRTSWHDVVPSHVTAAAAEQGVSGMQDFLSIRRVYLRNGQPAAYGVEMRDENGRIRAESLLYAVDSVHDNFVRFYIDDGSLQLEIEFNNGTIHSIDRHEYRDNRLLERIRLDGDGTELYRDRYSYRIDASMRAVVRQFPDGSQRSSQFQFQDSLLRDELHTSDAAQRILVRYDTAGRLTEERTYIDESVTELTRFFYANPEADRPETSRTERRVENSEIVRQFADGLEVETVYSRDGEVFREELISYNDDRQRIELIRIEGDVQTVFRYEYAPDGALALETLSKDGELQERRIELANADPSLYRDLNPPPDTTVILELYSDGQLLLRVYYQDKRRIREEVIENEEVIRVRNFEA